jgi:hypothetical protein
MRHMLLLCFPRIVAIYFVTHALLSSTTVLTRNLNLHIDASIHTVAMPIHTTNAKLDDPLCVAYQPHSRPQLILFPPSLPRVKLAFPPSTLRRTKTSITATMTHLSSPSPHHQC